MKTKLTPEEKALKKKEYHKNFMREWRSKVGREYLQLVESKSRYSENGKAVMLARQLSIRGICLAAFHTAKARAKKFNREFDITIEHLILIYPATHVCPIRFVKMKPAINKIGSANAPTLDRIDNNKGYILNNVRFISRSANSKKGKK